MAGILVQDVSKVFGSTPVLQDVRFEVGDGEFFSLVGPSGCGKSTLLRIIAGLEHQDAGSIGIGGKNVDALSPKQRNLAMVFQSYALYPYMTVAENIALPLEMRRLSFLQRLPLVGAWLPGTREIRREIAAEVDAVADGLSIGHLKQRRPAHLSGGQRQRVALARAMVRRPQAFLMDEPLSNLDAKMRVQARTEIAELHRRLGGTFIYVTHDQSEAMTMSDRIAVMLGGRLLQVAPPQTIYDEPATIEVARLIGSPEINLMRGAIRDDGALEVLGRTWPIDAPKGWGRDVQIGIRPEAWRVTRGRSEALVEGRIRTIELLGSETLVHFAVDGQPGALVVRIDPHRDGADLCVGARIQLEIAFSRVMVFDGDGRRVPHATLTSAQSPVRPLSEVAHG